MYRSMKSGVSDARASRGQGSTTGDLSTHDPPLSPHKGTSPQLKAVLGTWECGLSLPRDSGFWRVIWSLDFHIEFPYSNNGKGIFNLRQTENTVQAKQISFVGQIRPAGMAFALSGWLTRRTAIATCHSGVMLWCLGLRGKTVHTACARVSLPWP